MQTKIPCTMMRGGTSKGAYFIESDLPADAKLRKRVLLAVMGTPDPRQIDGLGGSTSLTSKVAVVKPSKRKGIHLDYLFTQVSVNEPQTSSSQNCGNILAGVGPFAVEKGLLEADSPETTLSVYMENTNSIAEVTFATPNGTVKYEGNAKIDGVPGTASPVMINFRDMEGSTCGSILPSGNTVDTINGFDITCIDNGMPVVLLEASAFNKSGYEDPNTLNNDKNFKETIEQIRLKAGYLMNLGDVSQKSIPKMTMVAPPTQGGTITTRSFIPHDCHTSIGVFAAVSVGTACLLENTIPNRLSELQNGNSNLISVEHPSGEFSLEIEFKKDNENIKLERAALLRTARLLFDGLVSIPNSVWDGKQ